MADEIPVVFLTAALSAPIETRHRMCRETDGDDWGWKSHLHPQPPYTCIHAHTYTYTHTHTRSWALWGKVLPLHGPACILLGHRVYESHEICILQINYTYTGVWLCYTHTSTLTNSLTHTHKHTCQSPFWAPAGDPAAVMSVLAATLLIVTLLKAEHFDSASRAVTVHGAHPRRQHINIKVDCTH